MLSKFKPGIFHLGFLIFILIGFFAIASYAIFADDEARRDRYISRANVYQSLCDKDPVKNQEYCKKAQEYTQRAAEAAEDSATLSSSPSTQTNAVTPTVSPKMVNRTNPILQSLGIA